AFSFELGGTTEIGQVDDKSGVVTDSAGAAHQVHGGDSGTAGGDEIVDEENLVDVAEHIGMDLDGIDAIFEHVVLPDGLARQLTALAHGDEANPESNGNASAKDEAARLDAGDVGEAHLAMGGGNALDALTEAFRMLDQGGDVAEQDS